MNEMLTTSGRVQPVVLNCSFLANRWASSDDSERAFGRVVSLVGGRGQLCVRSTIIEDVSGIIGKTMCDRTK